MGYQYDEQEVDIPEMRDYMIVVYQGGKSTMRRRSGGPWQTATVERGVVSLLTRAEQSIWHWDKPINVRHIYLSHDTLAETAEQVFGREPASIEIDDHLRRVDTVIPQCLQVLEDEMAHGGPGQNLLVDAVRTQIAVHLLRRFAKVDLPNLNPTVFSTLQSHRILEFIEEYLGENFGLESLASTVGLSPFHFSRKFKAEFGQTPHSFIIRKRIERAKTMLQKGNISMTAVALDCGFSDQSHFCRTFRRMVGVTPAEYRRSSV
jgi:AraC family transcriptional regulator